MSAGSTHRTATVDLRMGGYDATIGADPSTPIQFFTLVSRELLFLVHLDVHKLTLIASLAAREYMSLCTAYTYCSDRIGVAIRCDGGLWNAKGMYTKALSAA